MTSMDYDSRCEQAYEGTLMALRAVGLEPSFDSTGGGINQITVAGKRSAFDSHLAHLALSAGGGLDDVRRPWHPWELYAYVDGEQVAGMTMQYADKPANDEVLAGEIAGLIKVSAMVARSLGIYI